MDPRMLCRQWRNAAERFARLGRSASRGQADRPVLLLAMLSHDAIPCSAIGTFPRRLGIRSASSTIMRGLRAAAHVGVLLPRLPSSSSDMIFASFILAQPLPRGSRCRWSSLLMFCAQAYSDLFPGHFLHLTQLTKSPILLGCPSSYSWRRT